MEYLSEITIIGLGNQASAWALNFRDSGLKCFIGLRQNSASLNKAKELNFETFDYTKQACPSKTVCLLTPDDTHEVILNDLQKTNQKLKIILAHGFSISSSSIPEKFPNFEFILLAPKAIASEVRFRFEMKKPLTGFYSLEHTSMTQEQVTTIAKQMGIQNLYLSTFKEETEADLFSEQSLLCSILPYSMLEAYNTLVEKGYSKELAFFECFFESKLIVDTLINVGPEKFFEMISPNALIGSQIGKKKLLDNEFREKYQSLLSEIQNKNFNQEVEKTDFSKLRSEVSQYWKAQDLNKTYTRLKDTL